jgi:undecaprenyl-diphosphatase
MNLASKRFFSWDAGLSTRLRIAEKPGVLRFIAMLLAHSGDSWFWLAGLGVIAAAGSAFWSIRALWMITSILVTAILVIVIKFSVRRKRPESDWGHIYRQTDPHSFPSGHATRAVMLATFALFIGPAWFALVLIIWAPLVALARVSMGVHYVSDVLAGAILGVIIGVITGWLAIPYF